MLALVHIGMMKAGSTWLCHWLNAHPELAAPFETNDIEPGKNPYFWNRDHPYGRPPSKAGNVISPDAYRAAVANVKAFDLTDSYSYMTAGEIAALRAEYPDVLVSCTIRDPVEAAWSHMLAHCMTLEDLASDAGLRVLANADVERNLDRWRSAGFAMHLIWFDEIGEDPVYVLRRLATRLGIDPNWWDGRPVHLKMNERQRDAKLTPELRERIKRMIAEYGERHAGRA